MTKMIVYSTKHVTSCSDGEMRIEKGHF